VDSIGSYFTAIAQPKGLGNLSRNFGWSELVFLLSAVRWTLLLSMIAFAGGAVAGLLVALLRTAPIAALRWTAIGFIQLFQGTPVLMQLFVCFYGLPVLLHVEVDPWPAVTIAFMLYSGAFLGEIWRGTIQAIPRSQWEAAQSLSLSYLQQLRLVILPQAVRIAIPPTVGFLVQLIKGTSIASIIGVVELTRAGQLMTNVTFEPMLIYPIVALLYFALCWPLSLMSGYLEQHIDTNLSTKWSL
jgi:polar amino acid transport system permease protein